MDAQHRLESHGVSATEHRLLVVRALTMAARPQTPQELLEALRGGMNRVTLYRILDLLVEQGVASRHNAGERAFRYCLAGDEPRHAHFRCTRCGATRCLPRESLEPALSRLLASLPMRVDTAEFSLGGVCEACLGA